MKLSVLVPTYRRSRDLERCLDALKQQSYPASEILVVVRDTDDETQDFLHTYDGALLPLKILNINVSGVVAALNLGLDNISGDIVAITDDDAAPHPNWLKQIEAHFLANKNLGGLGGKDWIYENGSQEPLGSHSDTSIAVGKLQWFGRTIGNHHIGLGEAREVDILKGVNMSYRRSAIEGLHISPALRGTGAQVDNEIDLCLKVKKRGWKLVYDPQVAVDHFRAQRFDEDQRSQFNPLAQQNMAHNETYILLEHLPAHRKLVYLAWSLLVGTRRVPGLVQIIRLFPEQHLLSIERGLTSFQGRFSGIKTWLSAVGN
jgi:cellulose synthase/poly-beta-1,6-N-acetylglucosamine synthase-like glycosyltransferase